MDKNGVWWGAGAKELGYQELVETTPSGEEKIMEESASALGIAAGKTAPERPYPRETEADRTGDLTKLDRKLSRTLYLLVKGENEGIAGGRDGWRFPMARLQGDESLRQVRLTVLTMSTLSELESNVMTPRLLRGYYPKLAAPT